MDRVPMDIGEWIPEDAKKGALEAGAWMAEHPEALFEMTERDRKCRAAYIRELETGRYVGPTVRRGWIAERASRRERRESAWAICEKVMLVIAALGGIAAVADLVLSRLGL